MFFLILLFRELISTVKHVHWFDGIFFKELEGELKLNYQESVS